MKYLTHIIVAILVFIGIKAWDAFWYKEPEPVKPAIVNQAIKDIPKETVELKKGLKVYGKKANKELGVSKELAVISSVTCTSDTHDQTITSIVDPITGETETTIKQEPYKWLQSTGTKELSLGYGLGNQGALWTVTGRMDVFQVLAVPVWVGGSISSNQNIAASVGLRWVFK